MNVESSLTDATCHLYAVVFYSLIYFHLLKGLFHTDGDFNHLSVLTLTFTRVVFFIDALRAIGAAV